MSDDKVTVWNGQMKLGRSPAAGELLVGDGDSFKLTTLTEGSGVTITNSSGAITISASGSGGGVTSVTGTAPITSTEGATPDIALTVPLDVQYGGTGLSTLTSGNVLIGNGTSDVSLVSPGASGNVLTSNGTTWQSATPTGTWTLLKKTTDQNITSSTTFVDISGLTFTMAANTTYAIRSSLVAKAITGGLKIAANGTTAATSIRFNGVGSTTSVPPAVIQSYATSIFVFGGGATSLFIINGVVQNGASPSTFSLQFAQATLTSDTTTLEKGSYLEYVLVA